MNTFKTTYGSCNGMAKYREAVNKEADQLIKDFGTGAHTKVKEIIRAARTMENARLELFLEKVAQEIADRHGERSDPS